jgi:SAM-dependent methyltransferase
MLLGLVVAVLVVLLGGVGAFAPSATSSRSSRLLAVRGSQGDVKEVKKQLLSLFVKEKDAVLAAPGTLEPVRERSTSVLGLPQGFEVSKEAGGIFFPTGVYTDFLVEKEMDWSNWSFSPENLVMEGTFQSPLTSFLYERGWRSGFNANGFPGIEKEFEEVLEFFKPVAEGGVVVDLSCGSGLMARRLTSSKVFRRVIGADLSPTMLLEADSRQGSGSAPLELIRCDVANLPIQTESVDAIHAGAALHCWTRRIEALREVHRSLKKGGRFFASTFLSNAFAPTSSARGPGSSFNFYDSAEALQLDLESCGFTSVNVRQEGRACIIARCEKPHATD